MIWIAREGPTLVGQYATMPVRLQVRGQELDASWGMDVMVAPERQRQGIGEVLFRTWDRNVGASLGLGLSTRRTGCSGSCSGPNAGPVPCFVKPLTRRALPPRRVAEPLNRLVSAVTLPLSGWWRGSRPLRAEVRADPALLPGVHRSLGAARAAVRVRRPP